MKSLRRSTTSRPAEPEEPICLHPPSLREGWDLRARFMAIVAAAMLPVAAISFFQGLDRYENDRARAHARLTDRTFSIAAEEQKLLASAEQVLQALMRQDDVRAGGEDCARAFKAALSGLPHFLNLASADNAGSMRCSALAAPPGFNATSTDWWKAVSTADGFTIVGPIYGDISRQQILIGAVPTVSEAGSRDGVFWAAIDFVWLHDVLSRKALGSDEVFAIVTADGKIIASSAPALAQELLAEGLAQTDEIQTSVDSSGGRWSFAAAPLVKNDIFIVYAQTDAVLFNSTNWRFAANFLLPLFAVALASIAIWLSTERLITRWIVYLRRISAAYAKGRYSINPARLSRAPRELRDLGTDLAVMATAINVRDQALRAAIEQKEKLLREIHHRVKNNLQVVMSLLSILASGSKDPIAEEALDRARTRIGALALIHSLLNELDDQNLIDVGALLNGLCEQMRGAFGRAAGLVALDCTAEAFNMPVDVAAPLALLAVEAVTNSYQHGFTAGRPGAISVTLKGNGNRAVLSILDDGAIRTTSDSMLIAAFARQLGSTLTAAPQSPAGYKVEIDFPIKRAHRSPAADEVRRAPAPAA